MADRDDVKYGDWSPANTVLTAAGLATAGAGLAKPTIRTVVDALDNRRIVRAYKAVPNILQKISEGENTLADYKQFSAQRAQFMDAVKNNNAYIDSIRRGTVSFGRPKAMKAELKRLQKELNAANSGLNTAEANLNLLESQKAKNGFSAVKAELDANRELKRRFDAVNAKRTAPKNMHYYRDAARKWGKGAGIATLGLLLAGYGIAARVKKDQD